MADVILPPYHEDEKMLSGMAYPLWPFVCPLVLLGGMRREEPFVHFHSLQALALGGASAAAFAAAGLISFLFLWLLPGSFVTFSGFAGLAVIALIGFALMFWLFFVLYVAWRASAGEFLRLPFIGSWAEEKMQLNLNISKADYATTIIGEKHEVKIDAFDYEKALQNAAAGGDEFAQSEIDAMNGPEYTLNSLEGDPETIEYSRQDSGSIDDYLQSSQPAAEAKAAASDGFKPSVPKPMSAPKPSSAVQVPTSEKTKSEEFKPLAASLSTNAPKPAGPAGVRFNSDFSAPSAARAPQRTAPPAPPRPPSNPPSYAPQRSAASAPGKYQSHGYPPGSRPAGVPKEPVRPAASKTTVIDEGQDFTPGIISRPAPKSKRTFAWEQLDGQK